MSADNKEVYIDPNAVAAVDAKIEQSKKLTFGIMSSWANPLEGVSSGPKGTITKMDVKAPPTVISQTVMPPKMVFVPKQAMKQFKALLDYVDGVNVVFDAEISRMLLDSLQGIKTPKNMSDARAVINLMEALEKIK